MGIFNNLEENTKFSWASKMTKAFWQDFPYRKERSKKASLGKESINPRLNDEGTKAEKSS